MSNKLKKIVSVLICFLFVGCGFATKTGVTNPEVQKTEKDSDIVKAINTQTTELLEQLNYLEIKSPTKLVYSINLKYKGVDYTFFIYPETLYKLNITTTREFTLQKFSEVDYQKTNDGYVFFKITNKGSILNIYTLSNEYSMFPKDLFKLKVLQGANTLEFDIAYNGLVDKKYYESISLKN
jgi:hypothetical protein